ncbi:MAG: hypothetical protein ACR2RF_10655 [Geminicoccaceae bacterium]
MHYIDGTNPITSWWIAIVLLIVVTLVVAFLLRQIIKTAIEIDDVAAEIWVRGQRVANNTIHIASLHATKDAVGGILGRAGRIAGHATAIREHAESCPGCPACIWQGKS